MPEKKIVKQKINLSIIIPVYNEARRIGATLSKIKKYFANKKIIYELILVNDGSIDATLIVAKDFESQFTNFYIINFDKNYGKGHAVKSGMLVATGELRLFMDADSSVEIENIQDFSSEIINGSDIVIASIYMEKSKSLKVSRYRRILGKISKFFVKKVLNLEVADTQRGFKLFTQRVAETIFPRLSVDRYAFDIEILLLAKNLNLKVKELPVSWTEKNGSKVGLKDYFLTFLEFTKIVLRNLFGWYS